MAPPVAYVRPGSTGLLAAALTVAALGCGAQAPPRAGAASGADTAALSPSARAFLATLSAGQRADATFPFADPGRTQWAYVPQARSGVPLKAMNAEQRAAAFALLGSGLSERGTRQARGIIELEGILGELEGLVSRVVLRRDPGLYFTSVFTGTGGAHPWGWRFEGHHLSVNVTELGPHGQLVAPVFMGANPARVPSGPKAGHRLLAAEEDQAFALLGMLDAGQRARATIAAETYGDIVTKSVPKVDPMAFAGLPAAEMTAGQQGQLRRLLDVYAGRMADSSARRQLRRIDEAGFARLHFAWAGAHRPGSPHYYRIHGPTVLVEYDNSQNGANHIHTVWRDLENDFGGDLLRKHYAQQPHRP
ncbi:DUF3500 domain-containing protein [Roseisolibacter sp. H3M3-2]|uniref:DUF3500 domain-containing protein n=1 Tax=Roseisolibacter sp. H3M3-2 TaxID=3031323 RepID=UPI0023DCBCFE|nr:DUF3500 domain-containing protein [Roseisolibacter sp. H3M3-2]MDF1503625.1 DUF3500 domain-containing protein [Roseisolibacter sp. H3M3-2]